MGLLSHCVTALFRTQRVGGLTLLLGACFSVYDRKGHLVGLISKTVSRSSYDAWSRQQQTASLKFSQPRSSHEASGFISAVAVDVKPISPGVAAEEDAMPVSDDAVLLGLRSPVAI